VTRVFADSFYFLALFNPRDAAHDRAMKASAQLAGTLVTTDWILTETADALCDPVNRSGCAELINDLRASPYVEIEPASRAWFDAGWALYRQRKDKAWSLTDCISFAVMRERGIAEALTADHDFEQAGFKTLLA
jgi:predicted nucleic acid-binding protein